MLKFINAIDELQSHGGTIETSEYNFEELILR